MRFALNVQPEGSRSVEAIAHFTGVAAGHRDGRAADEHGQVTALPPGLGDGVHADQETAVCPGEADAGPVFLQHRQRDADEMIAGAPCTSGRVALALRRM